MGAGLLFPTRIVLYRALHAFICVKIKLLRVAANWQEAKHPIGFVDPSKRVVRSNKLWLCVAAGSAEDARLNEYISEGSDVLDKVVPKVNILNENPVSLHKHNLDVVLMV